MQILTNPKELMDIWAWDTYCHEAGLNPYALNEGLMDKDERLIVKQKSHPSTFEALLAKEKMEVE